MKNIGIFRQKIFNIMEYFVIKIKWRGTFWSDPYKRNSRRI